MDGRFSQSSHSRVHMHHGHNDTHNHTHHHKHSHAPTSAPLRALLTALAITSVVFFAEIVGGWLTGSVALLADAMHMLSDAAGLIIAALAVIAGQRAASDRATFGHRRVEVLAAALNAATVLAISIFICIEAIRRLKSPTEIASSTMMLIALIGLVANAVSAWVLSRHSEDSINVRGAYLHVLVDMLGSLAVIAAGAVIHFTGLVVADVVASLLIAALVFPRAWQLLRNSTRVLLEQVPEDFEVERVLPALRAIDGVAEVHDLHLWSLDGVSVLATAHLTLHGQHTTAQNFSRVLDEAQAELRALGVDHATIQVELPEHIHHESICEN